MRFTLRLPTSLVAIGLLLVVPHAAGGAPDTEHEARAIESMLVAPCCFSQQVSVHQSPAAEEVRRDIRGRLAAGQTRDQIVDAYVARHGKRILAEPRAEGFDLTLHVMPFVLLLGSVGVGIALVRRFGLAKGSAPTPVPHDVQVAGRTALEHQLDDELRDLD